MDLENRKVELAKQPTMEEKITAKENLKASAKAKLMSGEAMTEEEAIEYLIMKDIPEHVWRDWDKSNKPRLVICKKSQLPASREWRNAWQISDELTVDKTKAA